MSKDWLLELRNIQVPHCFLDVCHLLKLSNSKQSFSGPTNLNTGVHYIECCSRMVAEGWNRLVDEPVCYLTTLLDI